MRAGQGANGESSICLDSAFAGMTTLSRGLFQQRHNAGAKEGTADWGLRN